MPYIRSRFVPGIQPMPDEYFNSSVHVQFCPEHEVVSADDVLAVYESLKNDMPLPFYLTDDEL